MARRDSSDRLAELGLTVDQLLRTAPSSLGGVDPARFSKLMMNCVQFSHSGNPSVPIAAGRVELIRVEVKDELLTIADIWGEKDETNGRVERVGARLYGLKTVALAGATVFMLLDKLPAGICDPKFFPASGTAVLLEDEATGSHMLKACGHDTNTGPCQGWIFNAIEA